MDRPATRAYLRRARSRSRDDIAQPRLIANGDNDRMVPTALFDDMHPRIAGSELTIYPHSRHGAIFQCHAEFAPTTIEFIDH